MKLKSFTLIEVMIASYIFMIVIMMVTSSFAMIRKSNENSDDTRVTSSCTRQVEDVFKSAVKSANFGTPIMKVITYNDNDIEYKLYDSKPADILVTTDSSVKIVGFATFEDPNSTDVSRVRVKTFVKKPDTVSAPSTNSYYYAIGDIKLTPVSDDLNPDPRKKIRDGFDISSIVDGTNVLSDTSIQRINSSDCSANNSGQSLDTIQIQRVQAYGSRSSVDAYSLEVRDKFYRAFADRATETKYSNLNLFVSNDAKNL
jgi:type II secretory pathway pseudopilin PulG